jgi:glycosyltransferase involved in cell wall biosynthesis
MEHELVSILIPVYNRAMLVGDSINSAISQTYRNIEIIIVDNCSTDNTWEVLKEYASIDSRIKIIRNSENVGPVRNWKKCLDAANGKYTKILFSDDIISENFIEETLGEFDLKTAFVLPLIENFNEKVTIDTSKYNNKLLYTTDEYLNDILIDSLIGFPVSPGCALFRTSDLRNSLKIEIDNPFGLDFARFGAGNDMLLFLNTARLYKYIKINNSSIAFFRDHKSSITIENDLTLFYNYVKFDFINTYMKSNLIKFKTILWFRSRRTRFVDPVLKLIDGNIDLLFLFKYIMKLAFRYNF